MKYTMYHVKKLAKQNNISLKQARFLILKNMGDDDDASDILWNFNTKRIQMKFMF